MNNAVGYLGTYPELAQIYAYSALCNNNRFGFCNKNGLGFEANLDIHQRIFDALTSLAKRRIAEKLSSSTWSDWQLRIATLAQANVICISKRLMQCEVFKIIEDIFEKELDIKMRKE